MFTTLKAREHRHQNTRILYNASTGSLSYLQRLKLDRKLCVHDGCVNTISWNESGSLILSGSDDQHLAITDPFNGKTVTKFRSGHRSNIFSAKFMPGSMDTEVVSCSGSGEIFFTDIEREDTYGTNRFDCHFGTTYKLLVIPNESATFLSCGDDGTVRFFDLRTKTSCSKFNCDEDVVIHLRNAVTAMAVDPVIPFQLAVASSDGVVRLYDRRMLKAKDTGGASDSLIRRLPSPMAAEEKRQYRITSLNYRMGSHDLLVNYSSENIYLFNTYEIDQQKCFSSRPTDPQGASCKQDCSDLGPMDGAGPSTSIIDSESGAGASSDNGIDSENAIKPIKRLRLRGDWSDTGPHARPESEEPAFTNTVMQRMSDLLTRMLNSRSGREESREEEEGEEEDPGNREAAVEGEQSSGGRDAGTEAEVAPDPGQPTAPSSSEAVAVLRSVILCSTNAATTQRSLWEESRLVPRYSISSEGLVSPELSSQEMDSGDQCESAVTEAETGTGQRSETTVCCHVPGSTEPVMALVRKEEDSTSLLEMANDQDASDRTVACDEGSISDVWECASRHVESRMEEYSVSSVGEKECETSKFDQHTSPGERERMFAGRLAISDGISLTYQGENPLSGAMEHFSVETGVSGDQFQVPDISGETSVTIGAITCSSQEKDESCKMHVDIDTAAFNDVDVVSSSSCSVSTTVVLDATVCDNVPSSKTEYSHVGSENSIVNHRRSNQSPVEDRTFSGHTANLSDIIKVDITAETVAGVQEGKNIGADKISWQECTVSQEKLFNTIEIKDDCARRSHEGFLPDVSSESSDSISDQMISGLHLEQPSGSDNVVPTLHKLSHLKCDTSDLNSQKQVEGGSARSSNLLAENAHTIRDLESNSEQLYCSQDNLQVCSEDASVHLGQTHENNIIMNGAGFSSSDSPHCVHTFFPKSTVCEPSSSSSMGVSSSQLPTSDSWSSDQTMTFAAMSSKEGVNSQQTLDDVFSMNSEFSSFSNSSVTSIISGITQPVVPGTPPSGDNVNFKTPPNSYTALGQCTLEKTQHPQEVSMASSPGESKEAHCLPMQEFSVSECTSEKTQHSDGKLPGRQKEPDKEQLVLEELSACQNQTVAANPNSLENIFCDKVENKQTSGEMETSHHQSHLGHCPDTCRSVVEKKTTNKGKGVGKSSLKAGGREDKESTKYTPYNSGKMRFSLDETEKVSEHGMHDEANIAEESISSSLAPYAHPLLDNLASERAGKDNLTQEPRDSRNDDSSFLSGDLPQRYEPSGTSRDFSQGSGRSHLLDINPGFRSSSQGSDRHRRVGYSLPPTGNFQLVDDDADDDANDDDDYKYHHGANKRKMSSTSEQMSRAAQKIQEAYRRKREARELAKAMEVPQAKVIMKYTGHRNCHTMIKEANFYGDNFVISGSDCGRILAWERETGRMAMYMDADRHVVNCVQPNQYFPVLASSGIDYDIKIWTPLEVDSQFEEDKAEMIIRRNELMLEETRDTVTVPAAFMLRVLASLSRIRTGRNSSRSQPSSDQASSD